MDPPDGNKVKILKSHILTPPQRRAMRYKPLYELTSPSPSPSKLEMFIILYIYSLPALLGKKAATRQVLISARAVTVTVSKLRRLHDIYILQWNGTVIQGLELMEINCSGVKAT